MAMPIWGDYMQQVTKDTSVFELVNEFEKPEQPLQIEINCDNYQETDQKKLELIEE